MGLAGGQLVSVGVQIMSVGGPNDFIWRPSCVSWGPTDVRLGSTDVGWDQLVSVGGLPTVGQGAVMYAP